MRERKEIGSCLLMGRLRPKAAMLTPAAAGNAAGDLEIWVSGAAIVPGTCGQVVGRGAGWTQRRGMILPHAAPVAQSTHPLLDVQAPPP